MVFKIVRHVIMVVVDNFEAALKIGMLPTLLGQGLILAATYQLEGQITGAPSAASIGAMSGLMFLVSIVSWVLMAWVAVSWHRYVLLEQEPVGWFPPLPSTLGAYIWAVVTLALISVMIGLAGAMIYFVLTTVFMTAFGVFGLYVVGLIVTPVLLFVTTYFIRMSIILPARSIGVNLTVGEAVEKTKPLAFTLMGVVLCFFLVQAAATAVLQFAASIGIAQIIGSVAVNFLIIVINVSLLTTIYGIAVEGRTLR